MSTWKYPDKGELPEDGTYVLVEYCGGNWRDKDDQYGVNFKVMKFVKGKTKEELITSGWESSFDEGVGNNERPYGWKDFGNSDFFGQDVSRWMEIPGRK